VTGPPEDERTALFELSGLVLSEQTVDGLLEMIVGTAVSGLPNIDDASISLVIRDGGQFATVNASSAAIREVDEAQYKDDAGPCVQAIRTGKETMTELPSSSWPMFSDAALAAGFRAVWSIPLLLRARVMGALNLYLRTTDPQSDGVTARALARQATVVLANAASLMGAEAANRHLREALETRDLIGQAKGILMARESISADLAFDVLRRASQRSNRKLREIAAEIVERYAPDTEGGS
jgi:GAF domain-containing protein